MSRLLVALVLLVSILPARAGDQRPAATFHVAPPPLGNDANDGGAQSPFATLERARLAVRAHLTAHELRHDLIVELHDGIYELAAPVRFDAADSGKNGYAVVYRAAPGARPILSGGRRIEGWTQEADGVFRTEVGPGADFRQLWVDGRRAIRARTPNAGRLFALADEKRDNGFDLPKTRLAGVALRPNEIEMSLLIAWMHKRLRIERLEAAAQPDFVRAVVAAPEWDGITNQPQGDRVYRNRHYWLENAREFLDAPGEFHLDRPAGVLRYRPRRDEDIARAVVIRPELENLIVLQGTPDAPVHDLRFEGLTFAYTGWTRPNRHGFVDVQANSLVPASPADAVDPHHRHNQRKDRVAAAFEATTSDRIAIRHCRFLHLGGTGVMFSRGGDDNVIEGNAFYDLSGGGIEIGDDAVRPASPRLIPRRNRVANNFIARVGEDYFGSVAILGYYTDAFVIAHNEIAALPYTAVSQGWGWGQPPAPDDSRRNRILHNRVFNYMRRLDDGGGLYTTDRQPESEMAFNWVERMVPPVADTKAGGALYLDQCTEGYHVHHNVVIGAIRWLNIWNPNIRGNRVDTNFADTASLRNDGSDNLVEPAHVTTNGPWPEAARAIMASAGLEPAFAHAREFGTATDVITDTTTVDYEELAGPWTTSDRDDTYAGHARESRDSDAAARWSPILPKSGRYVVSVWQPAGAAATSYTIRHAAGATSVSTPPTETAGWVPLGRFDFSAGIGAEVEVRRADQTDGRPLVVDTLRCRWTNDN